MGRGQSLIVWAIAEGRSAAASIDTYLTGRDILPHPIRLDDRPLVQECRTHPTRVVRRVTGAA